MRTSTDVNPNWSRQLAVKVVRSATENPTSHRGEETRRMRKRLFATALAVVTAAVAVAACGSSSSSGGSGSGSGGKVTLKLVVADYGTGPSNTSHQVLAGDRGRLPQGQPVDHRQDHHHPLDQLRQSEVQTMVQNHNYPDITEGDYFSSYAQQGLLYPASKVLSNPGNLLPVFAKQGTYNGTQYGMPFTTSSRTLFYNKKLFAAGRHRSAPARRGPTSRPTPPRSRRWATSASASRSARRRRRRSRCCGSWATAATTRTRRASGRSTAPRTSSRV